MYADLDELVKEIEQFKENMKDSGQICKLLEKAVKQIDDYRTNSEKEYDRFLSQLNAERESYAKQLALTSEEFSAHLKEHTEQAAAEQQKGADALDRARSGFAEETKKIECDFDEKAANYLDSAKKDYELYAKELAHAVEQVREESTRLESSLQKGYSDFLNKVNNTELGKLIDMCQTMEKRINTKLSIALGGVAITAILAIISIVVR